MIEITIEAYFTQSVAVSRRSGSGSIVAWSEDMFCESGHKTLK